MPDRASIIASATLESALRTSRRGRQIDGVQNRRKHCAWFLTKKPLCCCGSVRAREEKVVNRGQACPLTWQVKPSKVGVAQRQIPVSPFDIRTRTLENFRELFGLLPQVALGLGTQLTQGAAGFEQWRTKAHGQFPKRLAMAHRSTLGYAFEIK